MSTTTRDSGADKGTNTLLEQIAEKLGANAQTTRIFGEPIEKDGVSVITVAKARYGFGGGSGGGPEGEGAGGGGGLMITPTGYIEIRDGAASYHPIYDPMTILGLAVGGGFAALLLLRGLRKLVR